MLCVKVADSADSPFEMNNFRNQLDTVINIASMYYELSCLDSTACKYYALRWQSCCARLISVESGYTVILG
jgi:hypothetical protein